MLRALLIRHCESSGPAPDAPLTPVGRTQAIALAGRLAAHPIDHIVSSPYPKARATIEPFATRARLPIRTDERLAERRLSREPIADWREVVRRSFSDPDHRVPGGESGGETVARGWAAIRAVLEGGHELPAVVSHGQLLSLVLHSIDPAFGYAGWESLTNPDVHLLETGPGGTFTFRRLGSE
jgi:2,3-bisphosphoglycerate-dependent phosphoglycerate mutase